MRLILLAGHLCCIHLCSYGSCALSPDAFLRVLPIASQRPLEDGRRRPFKAEENIQRRYHQICVSDAVELRIQIFMLDALRPLLTLSNTLLGASNDLPDWFEEAFEARQHLFTPDTFGGLTKITSKTVVPQNSIKWTDEERKLADEASSKLGLPSDEALVLIRSWKILQYGPAHWQDGDDDEADDLWWDRLQDFYFEERLTAIKFLSDVAELGEFLIEFNAMRQDSHTDGGESGQYGKHAGYRKILQEILQNFTASCYRYS